MADDERPGERPGDDFGGLGDMFRRMFEGGGARSGGGPFGPGSFGPGSFDLGSFDPAEFERVTGMKIDPAMMAAAMAQLRQAFEGDGGISWNLAEQRARQLAGDEALQVTDAERAVLDNAFGLAALWLDEKTSVPAAAGAARVITRRQWIDETMPVWQQLATPVATSIADALTRSIAEQVPGEMQGALEGAGKVLRTVGGSVFATQLGQVLGELSKEVLAGGDTGASVMPTGDAALVAQNVTEFARELELPEDQVGLFLAVRELAHARLFRHAKWLRLHVISQVTEYARGIRVDTSPLEDLASRFDPSRPDELRGLIESGALLPEESEQQKFALGRLETLLATIEGWVDVVAEDATARLPKAGAIAESIRRRRASGGPAERALGSLVGLDLRPRRLREAAAMWRAVGDALGAAARDALWDYPDFLPTDADIDDPQALIARMRERASADGAPLDALDDAIARILAGEEPDSGPGAGEPGEGPEGPRMV